MQTIEDISALYERVTTLEATLATQEAAVKKTAAEIQDMVENVIPEAMEDIGLTEVVTSLGIKVELDKKVRANISKDRAPKALAWLRENGHSKLIKRVLSVSFAKGEDDKAAELLAGLSAKNLDVDDKEGVHASTLRSFVTNKLEEGEEIPDDLFGIHVQTFAKFSKASK